MENENKMNNLFSQRVLQGFSYTTLLYPDTKRFSLLSLNNNEIKLVKKWQYFHFVFTILMAISCCIIAPIGSNIVLLLLGSITVIMAALPTILYYYFTYFSFNN